MLMRSDLLTRLKMHGEPFDLLVIGGGATGLSTALDAVARGYSVALVERYDFAQGTSSRSTKLVHGGVRYLRQGNVSLVREALRERALLLRNAPHLTRAMDFVIPCQRVWEPVFYGVGLRLYDALAGKQGLAPSRLLGRTEVVEALPGVESAGLSGGVVYQDGQFDDARLALALALTAIERGALVLNYVRCDGLLKHGGRVAGARLTEVETGESFEVLARSVVNATGVFVDEVRRQDEPRAEAMVTASQGAHVVLPGHFLPGNAALMVPKTDDGRVFFAVPWQGRVVLGTTDTPVPAAEVEPRPMAEEIDFILSHARRFLVRKPDASDVLSVYAGLRPLVSRGSGASTATLRRDHTIVISGSGLVTVTGGKWTTCRKMGEEVVDRVEQAQEWSPRPSVTEGLRLHGAANEAELLPADDPRRGYGTAWQGIQELERENPVWAQPVNPSLPLRRSEVIWQARSEMARSVEDVLARRTRLLVCDASASAAAAPEVGRLLSQELGWTAAREAQSVAEFQALAKAAQLR